MKEQSGQNQRCQTLSWDCPAEAVIAPVGAAGSDMLLAFFAAAPARGLCAGKAPHLLLRLGRKQLRQLPS